MIRSLSLEVEKFVHFSDPPTRHTNDTVPKIVPAKMTSLDAISCKRNKSSSRSLALVFFGFHVSEIALPKKTKNSELDLCASLYWSLPKGLAKIGNIVAETLLHTQTFTSLAAQETYVAEANLHLGSKEMLKAFLLHRHKFCF